MDHDPPVGQGEAGDPAGDRSHEPALPAVLLARMAANVARKGRLGGAFVRALPLTAMLTVSWSLGELVGYVTGRCPTSAQ